MQYNLHHVRVRQKLPCKGLSTVEQLEPRFQTAKVTAVASQNERQQGIRVECSIFWGQKRANEITHKSCDTMTGKLIELFDGSEFSGQNEARTNMADCSAANLNKYVAWIWKK